MQSKRLYHFCLVIIIVLGSLTSVNAADYKLYKNFKFGAPRNDILKIKGIYDCSKDSLPGSLCLNNHRFLGFSWDMEFIFFGDKLVTINLIAEFDQNKYVAVAKSLAKKFFLVALQSKDGMLDMIELLKKVKDKAAYQQKIGLFEKNGLEGGVIKYFYCEDSAISSIIKAAKNITDLVQKAEENMREADFEIYETDDGKEAWCKISFMMPKMVKKLVKEMPVQEEDF